MSSMVESVNDAARLQAAEDRLSSLEKEALALSSKSNTNANNNNNDNTMEVIRSFQQQMLEKLKAIRAAMVAEGSDIDTIRSERDAAAAEVVRLKKENARLDYRVKHLIKMLNEEEAKNK